MEGADALHKAGHDEVIGTYPRLDSIAINWRRTNFLRKLHAVLKPSYSYSPASL